MNVLSAKAVGQTVWLNGESQEVVVLAKNVLMQGAIS